MARNYRQQVHRSRFFRAFNIGEFVQGKPQQPLPQALQVREGEIGQFADLCRQLCMRLLELCAIGLKVRRDSYFVTLRPQFMGKPDSRGRRRREVVLLST